MARPEEVEEACKSARVTHPFAYFTLVRSVINIRLTSPRAVSLKRDKAREKKFRNIFLNISSYNYAMFARRIFNRMFLLIRTKAGLIPYGVVWEIQKGGRLCQRDCGHRVRSRTCPGL